ncbi:MAG: hypothetical protein AMJ70_06855, partial [Dehalococcoidia bacterium SG8_51_3]
PPSLVELLKVYRADQELLRIQLGVSLNTDDFVFIRPDGNPINPNAVTLAFRRIIKRAGLRDIRIYDLRHTHATLIGMIPVNQRVCSISKDILMPTISMILPNGFHSSMISCSYLS